jgi:O-antigen/teichoic acid export membrane protein
VLAGRAAWSFGAELVQVATSFVVFFGLVRLLPVAEVAFVAAVASYVGIAGGLSNFGAQVLLLRRHAASGDLAASYRIATSVGFIGAAAGMAGLAGLRSVLLPEVALATFALLVLSQGIMLWAVELATHAGVATGDLRLVFALRSVTAVTRIAGLGGFWLLGPEHDLGAWAAWALLSTTVSALAASLVVAMHTGARPSLTGARFRDFREGLPFSLNFTTESVLAQSDRPVLIRAGHVEDAARYAVGARIADLGIVPVIALIKATDSQFFEAGARGPREALRAARRLLPAGLGVGAVAFLALFAVAPVLPHLFGPEYEEAVVIIRAMALLPAVRALQYIGGNVLTASGHQVPRLAMTIAAAAVNLGGNIAFVPRYSWAAAVAMTYLAEVLLAAGCWVVAFRLARRSRPPGLT